ncbi:sporulation protein [Streptomyces sp. TRM64462]|uniref:sporulation protein n=1 Tax=Streptomyces sp. TRM64462 TaxID=2741726 RepID=UPI001585FD4C|nr:sporulation protein [Streptomyces sp. TRM64462]
MVFKRLLGSLGVGGPTVDTVLDPGPVMPGGTLSGEVRLKGGKADFTVDAITLELVARVEAEHDGGESQGVVAFERYGVGGGFRLAAEEERSVPFTVTVPWETPVTELHGQPLGIGLGVRTELAVASAKDKGDLDPLAVRALPAQEAVLEAFGQLGFGFVSADLEYGHIGGTGQRLPFYQEIELSPAPRYAHAVDEIEVTFLAHAGGMEVVLEADRRGGLLSGGRDALNRFTVTHEAVGRTDWNAEVEGWVRSLVDSGAAAQKGAYGHGHGHDAHHGHGHGHGHGHSGRGPGVGTVVAAGAAGLAAGAVGGYLAAEAVDEIGDFFEGDEDDEA